VTEPPLATPAPDRQLVDDLAAAGHKIAELEAILDTATDGVAVVDANGCIVRINRSAEALFGVDSADVAGLPFTHLLAEESRKSALDYLEGLAQNGVASVLNDGREVIGRVPQGGLIPLFMTMGRLGETGKFCAVLRDITQWKNAEEELINARRAAETASMQKSDFLARVSHEIRTPLNAIIGFSEVMMEERFGPIGTERYKEYLRDINVSGAHLMSLLNDLLDLSKIEAGKLDLNFEAVALNEIVMECVAMMQPQANRERIIIRTSLSSQVPSIVADPRSIRQIVLNLVSNAVKFTLAGGQVIVSTALEERGEVTLRIRDTGIGMSEKDVETALMPFRQVASAAKHRSDGTGLGLPLTKALVEANRAAFLIDSAVGQGTLIRVTFPSTRVLAG
jgi:PAS domain S-box-containing protein